jgi:hypothetical protein
MERAANWISITLHPVFMPLITLWLALRVDPHLGYFLHEQARWMVLLMVGVMTVVFPLTSTLLLMRAGLVGGMDMPDRRERVAPFVMTLIYYAMAYYLLQRSPLHPAVLSLFTGALVALAITIAITLYWKISVHMVGIGGLIGALWGLSSIHGLPLLGLLAAFILVAGMLGSARLYVGDHRQMQVHAGLALGAVCTYTCVAFGWAF